MFCTKCGERNEEGARFCTKCGEPLSVFPYGRTENMAKSAETKLKFSGSAALSINRKKKKIIFAAIILVIVFAAAFFILSGRGSDKLIKEYVQASIDCDAETIWNLMPEEMRENILIEAEDEMNLYGEDEVIAYLQEMMNDAMDSVESLIGDWDYTWEIVDEKDYDESELRELNQELRSNGLEGYTADDAKDVTIAITVTSNGESATRTLQTTLVKIDRKWYIGEVNF